ncbi:hypothetical protein HNV10_08490 [Winogradskyella litoriviva]|uniref:Uncharacterized protein n=1 Tax=Winogradskyella litoriviva TaxID=1220182 RepID=A0ABX2E4D1_9FLAO|nr:hypothetical protein [Winogradskyella litoriviva]NRD23277.1 hypothetical protein [Winogradskyella litoriviva]
MGEFLAEVIFTGIFESIPKLLGTIIRWCFYLGKRPFKTVFKEDWNRRVGFLAIALIISIIILIY